MPTYTLTYFNGKGRAEVARLLFAKAGVAFEDKRLTREEWAPLKDSTPFGTLPLLEVDGTSIAQSYSIVSFLAKRFGLHGKTDIEEAQINSICLAIDDILSLLVNVMMEKDEAKKETLKKTIEEEKLPTLLKFLNRIIEKNGSGCFVGKEMSLADIYFASNMNGPKIVGINVDLSKFPKLQAVKDKVEADPKIAEWIKNRPETAM